MPNEKVAQLATRFRDLKESQMKVIDDFLRRGCPVIGMRTATHAFNISRDKPFGHYGNGYGGGYAGSCGIAGVLIQVARGMR